MAMALYDADIIIKTTGTIIGMNPISGWKMRQGITRMTGSRFQGMNCGSWWGAGGEGRDREAGGETN
jgi:hypothetical protein